MFCDLVGSVALGEQMDLEDYRDLLDRYRRAVVDAIERYDGESWQLIPLSGVFRERFNVLAEAKLF